MTVQALDVVSELDKADQMQEVEALQAIFGQDYVLLDSQPFKLEISINIELVKPREVLVKIVEEQACATSSSTAPADLAEASTAQSTSSEAQTGTSDAPRLHLADQEYVPLAVLRAEAVLEERGRWLPSHASKTEVMHLPPLKLHVEFRAGYPSERPPRFTLAASWLSAAQLAGLCAELDCMAEEQSGSPIVFHWTQCLQDSAMTYLDVVSQIELSRSLPAVDERAISDVEDPFEAVYELVQFDRERRWWLWQQSPHTCSICFADKPGSSFTKIGACEHSFCNECMSEMLAVHITDGTVGSIKCPQLGCRGEFGAHAIRALATEEQFRRWWRFKVQLVLKEDPALVYCPRCEKMGWETPVCPTDSEQRSGAFSDLGPPLAVCDRCQFSFCAACREPYHPSSMCGSQSSRLQKLHEQMALAQAAERRKLDDQLASLRMIMQETKPCPQCKMPIVRSQGCNHMVCTNCSAHFCYRCGTNITDVGYGHFRADKCPTFDREEVLRMQHTAGFGNGAGGEALDAELEELRRQFPEQVNLIWMQPPPGAWRRPQQRRQVHDVQCPSCRQWNPRTGTNNHVRCRYCKCNFCYQCQKSIHGMITKHFRGESGCMQHS